MNDRGSNGEQHSQRGGGPANAAPTFRLIPATYTPMHSNGEVDYDAIPRYADDLLANGIRDIFVNGTTGEGLSLTTQERLNLVEAWERRRNGLCLLVHVGDNCLDRSIKMAAHAEQHGADGIAGLAPTFFRPECVDTLLDFLEPMAAAAPATKFYFYHMPSMTGVSLDMCEFVSKAVDRIPNFAGVKYTHENLEEFGKVSALWGDKLEFFFGRDELLLPALSVGAKGAVGSFYSLIPKLFQQVARSFQLGDLETALAYTRVANKHIDIFKQVGVLAAGKFTLAERGIGSGKARLPLKSLDRAQGEWLLRELSAAPSPPATSTAEIPAPHISTVAGQRPQESPL